MIDTVHQASGNFVRQPMVDLIHCDNDDDTLSGLCKRTIEYGEGNKPWPDSYQSNIGTSAIVWLAAGRRVIY
jgi:hypothetical protein